MRIIFLWNGNKNLQMCSQIILKIKNKISVEQLIGENFNAIWDQSPILAACQASLTHQGQAELVSDTIYEKIFR